MNKSNSRYSQSNFFLSFSTPQSRTRSLKIFNCTDCSRIVVEVHFVRMRADSDGVDLCLDFVIDPLAD